MRLVDKKIRIKKLFLKKEKRNQEIKRLEKVFRNLGRSRLLHLTHKLAWSFPAAEGKGDQMEDFRAWKKEFQEAQGWEMED